jgi:hypothetical protein
MADTLKIERRSAPRRSTFGSSGIDRARLRPGRTADVLDLSSGGALVETDWRMLPGTRVEMQFGESTTGYRVAGRILRCHVAHLDRERIRYRGALRFDAALPFGEVATPPGEHGS